MTAALLYRGRKRWQIWAAFGGAAAIHMVAVAIAENRSHGTVQTAFPPPGDGIEAIDVDWEESLPQIEVPPIQEQPLAVSEDQTFRDENLTPPAIRPGKIKAVAPTFRRSTGGTGGPASVGSAKVRALSAPRPEYPYEARRQRTTGSGVAVLTVNPASGNVIDVRMSQSTGSAILDISTVNGLRRWRFKRDDVTTVQVPITFTLTGVVY